MNCLIHGVNLVTLELGIIRHYNFQLWLTKILALFQFTRNIAIFAGGEHTVFKKVLPVLSIMDRSILHIGTLGSASILKVVTNYLATAKLVTLGETLTVAKQSGMDLAITYEAIRISSGNSFVHETEN